MCIDENCFHMNVHWRNLNTRESALEMNRLPDNVQLIKRSAYQTMLIQRCYRYLLSCIKEICFPVKWSAYQWMWIQEICWPVKTNPTFFLCWTTELFAAWYSLQSWRTKRIFIQCAYFVILTIMWRKKNLLVNIGLLTKFIVLQLG